MQVLIMPTCGACDTKHNMESEAMREGDLLQWGFSETYLVP